MYPTTLYRKEPPHLIKFDHGARVVTSVEEMLQDRDAILDEERRREKEREGERRESGDCGWRLERWLAGRWRREREGTHGVKYRLWLVGFLRFCLV